MDIPQELYAHEIIRYLPIKDILTLCKTNTTLKSICQDDNTWKFLLERDFKGEFPEGKDSKTQYMYAKKIHDMSDIHSTDIGLRLLGYIPDGNVMKLKAMDGEEIYKYLLATHLNPNIPRWYDGWVSLRSFSKSLINFNKWLNILPNIFRIIQHGNIGYVGMDIYHAAQIYDLYHGRDSFWNGFVKHLQPYLKSLTPEQLEDAREWIQSLFGKVYP